MKALKIIESNKTDLSFEQLQQTSDYINDTYNINTGVYEKTIYVSVWNNELSDTYDIEMSKEQTRDFYNEITKIK